VLRIDDTDAERNAAGIEERILEDLAWLGMGWDKGPYRQSERLDVYREHAERLVDNGLAYRCTCTRERLEELRSEQMKKGLAPRYDRRCDTAAAGGADATAEAVVRFRVPEGEVAFTDAVHGRLSFDASAFGDFVIIDSGARASYNFATVVDDALTGITHVIRGDDHLPNTPRQLLLYRALGLDEPVFAHVPLVVAPGGEPLGKRHAATSVRTLRQEGFLPSAVVNTLARLGWSPGQGLMTLDELAGLFEVEGLSKSPSIYDPARLCAFNRAAIAAADAETLAGLLGESGEEAAAAVEAVKANAATLSELKDLTRPFVSEFRLRASSARALLEDEGARSVLASYLEAIERKETMDEASCKEIIETVRSASGAEGKALFMPLRIALTGSKSGIEVANILRVLGRERVLRRLRDLLNGQGR